ncbi:MAG: ATP-binding protein [Anaerolineales bacterium]
MTLRKRLTLINTLLVGGILIFLGAVFYQTVSMSLVFEVDKQLKGEADRIIQDIQNRNGGLLNDSSLHDLEIDPSYLFQIWSRDKKLIQSSDNLDSIAPLSVAGFGREHPVYLEAEIEQEAFRVLSVPLVVGKRPAGTLMVGVSMSMVELILRSLANLLFWGVLFAVGMVGIAVWLSTRRSLAPLEEASNTAMKITRADDLARRIPYYGPKNDEVGQLIQSFNQTLERMEDLFKAQRRFISDVSHELRTPLTVMKGNVDLLLRMDCIEEEEEEIRAIDREVKRMTRMVQDLLLLAQAETGRMPMDFQEVSLDTLLLEVFQQAEVLADGKVDIILEEIDQVMIWGNEDRLKQVLINLTSNAIKYTPEGGEVRYRLGKESGKAALTVEDTGSGIPDEDLPHIFKRFYRTEKARTRSDDAGVGLGLSIVYWIVENHEGEIEVNSQVGQGTTVTVYFPLLEEGR